MRCIFGGINRQPAQAQSTKLLPSVTEQTLLVQYLTMFHQPCALSKAVGNDSTPTSLASDFQIMLYGTEAEGMGFEPTTGFPASDFESDR